MNQRHAHFYWGNTTLPWFQYLSMWSFRIHHPDWRVTLYRPHPHEQTAYPAGRCYFDDALKADIEMAFVDPDEVTGASLTGYDASSAWCQVFRSDVLRHWLLHRHGGIWSDVDVLYFRSVLGSSIDQGEVALVWDGEYAHTAVISATAGAEALRILVERQRALSPATQAPGGQSPFGPGFWVETFGSVENAPGVARARYIEFISEPNPESVAHHARGARIPWASMTPDNYAERIRDAIPSIEGEYAIQAIKEVLP